MSETETKEPEVKKTEPAAKTDGATPPAADPKPADTLPSDLFSDKIPDSEVLPLDGPVKVKDYAALPSDATEPKPSPNGSEPAATTFQEAKPGDSTAPAPAVVTPPPTPEEIQSQAAQTADLLIKGYDKLHMLGRWAGRVDESELSQMHAKGKINLDQILPLGRKSITVQDFFAEYNAGINENIVVSQEFKDNIRPPLIRECVRRGWLMNDMTYILVLLGEDVVAKTSMLVGLKKSANLVLDACKTMVATQKEMGKTKKADRTPEPSDNIEPPPAEENVDWREPTEKTEDGL